MFYRLIAVVAFTGFTAFAAGAAGGPAMAQNDDVAFGTLHVFGDSSSDNGNFYDAYGAEMHFSFGLLYANGAFSNGPVWGDYLVDTGLVEMMDNHAYAGAMTHAYGEPARFETPTGPLPTGLRTQIETFAGPFGEDDLVAIWVGFNDYLFGDLFGFDNTPAAVVANISEAVVRLDELGAKHVMVFNLPDMSRMPIATFIEPSQAIKLGTASAVHNALLSGTVAKLDMQLEAEVVVIDVFSAISQIIGYPERFGFTNATESCILVLADGHTAIPNPFSPCYGGNNGTPYNPFDDPMFPAGFVFWDPLHPSTDTHRLLANFTAATLASHAFGTATMGSANDVSSSTAGVVTMCDDPADGNWCY
jgi:phospholipase/lecithinase/hemolysin